MRPKRILDVASRHPWLLTGLAVLVAVVVVAGVLAGQPPTADRAPIPASYPEGPLYRGTTLYYAQLGADVVTVVEDGEARPFFRQPGCGPTAIAPYADGFLVLCHLGRRVVSLTAGGAEVRTWTTDADGVALLDPNDASADGEGGVYFSDPGVFSRSSVPQGRVMHLTADGRLTSVASSLWYPNGVHLDRPRGRLLVSEHLRGQVLSFGIGPDGSLGAPETVAELADAAPSSRFGTPYPETGPDGLEIGPKDELFVAVYGEGRIIRFGLDGTYRGQIELPTRYSTNISFAPDGTAATTGSFDNLTPPFPGEVRFHAAGALTGTPG